MRKDNTSYEIAICALMAALAIVFMLLSSLIPVLTYVSPMLASLTLIPVLYEFGKKYAWMTWGVTTALALMLCADREACRLRIDEDSLREAGPGREYGASGYRRDGAGYRKRGS